jgi:hypothetical protein
MINKYMFRILAIGTAAALAVGTAQADITGISASLDIPSSDSSISIINSGGSVTLQSTTTERLSVGVSESNLLSPPSTASSDFSRGLVAIRPLSVRLGSVPEPSNLIAGALIAAIAGFSTLRRRKA